MKMRPNPWQQYKKAVNVTAWPLKDTRRWNDITRNIVEISGETLHLWTALTSTLGFLGSTQELDITESSNVHSPQVCGQHVNE